MVSPTRPSGVAAPLTGTRSVSQPAPGLARALSVSASITLCVLLPVVMVLANKSAPVALALGCLLANGSALAAGHGRDLGRRYVATMRSGSGLLLAGFLLWSVASLAWTVSVPMTIRGLSETLPEVLFGWGLAAAWPLVARRGDLRWLAPGIVASALLIAFEAGTHLPLHKLLGARAFAFDLKRSSIPPLLLLWPAVALVSQARHWRMVVLLAGFAEVGSALSHSSASIVAVVLGLGAYLLARVRPRAALATFATVVVLALAVAPWTGTVMTRLMSPSVERLLEGQHARERVAIWNVFEDRVGEAPWLGHGFDASFRLGDGAGTPAMRPGDTVIDDIHPHNQLLQVWIDFGLVGAAGILAGLGWLVARMRHLPAIDLAPRIAFLASATMMGLVGVQAWDAWWLATLAVCWAAFTVLRLHPATAATPPDGDPRTGRDVRLRPGRPGRTSRA